MATRSLIGKLNKDGTVRVIYCHWDGYPEHNGRILVNHYSKASKVDRLLALGDVSSLAPQIGKKNSFDKPDRRYCVAYGRDRNEPDCQSKVYSSFNNVIHLEDWIEYIYLWDENNGWRCFNKYTSQWIPLDGVARIAA